MFGDRHNSRRGYTIPNENNNNNNNNINDNNDQLFGIIQFQLLLDCFEAGHIPYNLKAETNILEGLVLCGDYLTSNNDTFIMNKSSLIDYFDNCVPRIDYDKRKLLIESSKHPLLKESLNEWQNSLNNMFSNLRKDIVSNHNNVLIDKFAFDSQTAMQLFFEKFKLQMTIMYMTNGIDRLIPANSVTNNNNNNNNNSKSNKKSKKNKNKNQDEQELRPSVVRIKILNFTKGLDYRNLFNQRKFDDSYYEISPTIADFVNQILNDYDENCEFWTTNEVLSTISTVLLDICNDMRYVLYWIFFV